MRTKKTFQQAMLERGSLPIVECFEVRNFSHGEKAKQGKCISWGFLCPYCRCFHTHKAEEGIRMNVCRSSEGQKAWPFGYYVKLADS